MVLWVVSPSWVCWVPGSLVFAGCELVWLLVRVCWCLVLILCLGCVDFGFEFSGGLV